MDDAVLVANRFVALQNGTHLDLATSAIVRLMRRPIEEQLRATLEEEGARLCRLWHPAMSPYLDFGPLGEADWFEAVGIGSPGAISAAAVGRGDVGAFLRAQDLRSVTLEQTSLDLFSPSLLAAREERENGGSAIVPHTIRGFGIRLLPPQLISGVTSWLEETLDAGPHVWSIDAPPRSGWRTCWEMLAREARRIGFVPVDSNLLARAVRSPSGAVGTWLAALRDRSLLVAHHVETWTEVSRHNLAALIVVIGGLHSSTAVILDIVRTGRPVCARFALDAFSPFTLARAAWTGVPAIGERRLRAIATRAQGRPAEFVGAVSRLVNARDGGSPTVHERRPGHGPVLERTRQRRNRSCARAGPHPRVAGASCRSAYGCCAGGMPRSIVAARGVRDPRLWAELAVREGERRVSPAPRRVDAGLGASRGARGVPRADRRHPARGDGVDPRRRRDGRAPASCRDRGGAGPAFRAAADLALLLGSRCTGRTACRRCGVVPADATHVLAPTLWHAPHYGRRRTAAALESGRRLTQPGASAMLRPSRRARARLRSTRLSAISTVCRHDRSVPSATASGARSSSTRSILGPRRDLDLSSPRMARMVRDVSSR